MAGDWLRGCAEAMRERQIDDFRLAERELRGAGFHREAELYRFCRMTLTDARAQDAALRHGNQWTPPPPGAAVRENGNG